MLVCDLTLPAPEANLACDEALLDLCEAGGADELLRFWEPATYFVVVGYANQIAREVNLGFCQQNEIPVLRRCSGGGTVLQGPGCLNYTLVLRISESGPLHSISTTNHFILDRHQAALATLLPGPVEKQGHTDLAIGGLKFSGNAQRRRKNFLLFHGSFLLHFDIDLIEQALPLPSKQPDYRLNRAHADFLMNLNVPSSLVKSALVKAWKAAAPLAALPFAQINRLVKERYGMEAWNRKF
ncbi:MAG TPA: lipoate--protein ligase family protein [Candidatus Acidoferrum sp.]|jgi:lipoate-protein ligase A|nr:lipoate--protein ligase family protein [Candidatus Acidoferrum sp.]